MPEVRCGDLDIHYEEDGSGPPIVWIPGTGLCGSSWEPQVIRFREEFRCLTVDLRGSGQTRSRQTSGTDTEFTVAGLAQDVAAWLDAIGVTDAIVAGLSLGSAVAQELALARPDLVNALVLVATWSSTRREHHIRRHFESRLYALENGPLDVYAQFAFWMSSPSLYDHEPDQQAEVERLLATHMSANPAGTAGHFRADLSHETRDRLHQISCPTLVVHGEEDLITLPWYNRTVADLIPNASLAAIPAAGHLAWLERPGELNHLIDRFLTTLRGPSRTQAR
jgi:pimeloyl-ACP methyl ester carboxylesterase